MCGFFGSRNPSKLFAEPTISTTLTDEDQKFFDVRTPAFRFERFCVRLPALRTPQGFTDKFGKPELSVAVPDGSRARKLLDYLANGIVNSLEAAGHAKVANKFAHPINQGGYLRLKFQRNTKVYTPDGEKCESEDIIGGVDVVVSASVAGYNFSDRAGIFFRLVEVQMVEEER